MTLSRCCSRADNQSGLSLPPSSRRHPSPTGRAVGQRFVQIFTSVLESDVLFDFSAFPIASKTGRILRTFLRLVPRKMVVPVLQGRLRGARWIVGSSTHGCWLGTYESPKQDAFARAIRPGDLVVDAGANVGFYTLLAARIAGPTGRVVAFEPVARNLDYLRRHVELNHVHNVRIEACALWKERALVTFDESHDASQG